MAVNQNAIPAALRPLIVSGVPITVPGDPSGRLIYLPADFPSHQWPPPPPNASSCDNALDEEDEQPPSAAAAAAKIKLLCSFNGRVLPRPSDGELRYVGGHTRIISLRRDVSFGDFISKMVETYGGPVAFKYQLPDEDLDALISVSCTEDLDNMIEEYEKLEKASPEGSVKLRSFLFAPSEVVLDPTGSGDLLGEQQGDSGQLYVEAVNGISIASSDCPFVPPHKDNGSSAHVSTQTNNSDCRTVGEGADGSINDGTSSSLTSPKIGAPHVGGVAAGPLSAPLVGDLSSVAAPLSAPLVGDLSSIGLNMPATSFNLTSAPVSAPSFLSPPSYRDPNHIQYVNSHKLGVVGGPSVVNQFITPSMNPSTYMTVHPQCMAPLNFSAAPSIPQVSNSVKPVQSRLEPYIEESPYGIRATDQNYKASLLCDQSYNIYQPLSAPPPLPPSFLQQQNVEKHELRQVQQQPHELQQRQAMRYEECNMCQRGLFHNHFDIFVQDNGTSSAVSVSGSSPVFNNHFSVDTLRVGEQQRAIPGGMAGSILDHKVENTLLDSQLGNYGPRQVKANEIHYVGERQPIANAENSDHANVLLSTGGVGFPADVHSSYAIGPSNLPHSQLEDTFVLQQQQQQHQMPQNLVQPKYPVKTEVTTMVPEAVSGLSYDYGRPISQFPEALPIITSEPLLLGDQCIPVIGSIADLKAASPEVVMENGNLIAPQVTGIPMYPASTLINPGIAEGVLAKPMEQLISSPFDVTHLQNIQHADTILVPTMTGNLVQLPERGIEAHVPNESLLQIAPQSLDFDVPNIYDAVGKVPIEDLKGEVSQHRVNNCPTHSVPLVSTYVPLACPNTSSLVEQRRGFPESLLSDSLFANQDPWKIVGCTNLLPPKPIRVSCKGSNTSKESVVSSHLENGNGLNLDFILEEGDQPSDRLNSEILEPAWAFKESSAEEQIKRDLQSVAEGVATSVLESSMPDILVSFPLDQKEQSEDSTKEFGFVVGVMDEVESAEVIVDKPIVVDINDKDVEKINLGMPNQEDIGHLQIIKYIDLEELRELGSGTFGTVFHGKWRGTDVAIKRINERCFTGKKSEQERMRADFWNEARKLADLHHPNVLAFYGVCLDGPGGSVATVTEFMVNGSLRHALQRNEKAIDWRKRLLIAMDVAFGMEYLHSKNIVHFDLKSDNLLVNLRDSQRPICKVGDLGLSKVKCKTLISGGVRGTLPYMAPELLNGVSSLVSEKVDVFSFGIVMWEVLTGEEPYADLYYGAIIGGIVNNTLRPQVPESCDPEWRALMERCWSPSPSERPNFTEIVDSLRAMAAALPIKGHVHPAVQAHAQK